MSSKAATSAGRRRAAARTSPPRGRPPARSGGGRRPPSRSRRRPERSRRRPGRLRRLLRPGFLLAILALLGVLAAGYFLWFRDLGIFAVERVDVRGADGPEAAEIVRALEQAGQGMSTLHVDHDALAAAVAPYPTVAAVSASADFPSGLVVEVRERRPVLLAKDRGGGLVPLADDGTVLPGVQPQGKLPTARVDELPRRGRARGEALAMALVLGAAPEPLAKLVEEVSFDAERGVEVVLEGGLPVRFGGANRATEKWQAAAAVLAEPSVTQLSYLDVRVPERPALGGATEAQAETLE